MTDIPCAVISSTVHDLPAHREAAKDACLRQDFFPKMMELQAPSPADAVRLSRNLVDQADVYILILGWRYGEIPDGQDKSFTHLELDRANERGIPKLVLLMHEDHLLTAQAVETGPGAQRVRELREQLRRSQDVNFFRSAEELRSLLIHGLSEIRNHLRPREASFHHVSQIVTPPEPYIAHPYILLQTSEVIGRQRELNVLTAWVTGSDTRSSRARIMNFIAIGGTGKSAVTWKWFNEVAPHEMRPLAGRVWWSFYESDARFDNFVARTLAYTSRLSLEQVEQIPAPEREELLLKALDAEPYLIVLDGLERLLLAYARLDAAHLADDDLDTQTANIVAGALGLPPGAAASFTGQSRLRMTADPRVGHFLQRLAAGQASRVLTTSRLYPVDLQTITGEPVQGSAAYFVAGLSDDDAVNLWRAFGVSGGRRELISLFNTFGNYPLLIRALAGEVARFRPAPGDFDRWRQAHPDFDPFAPDFTQRSLVQRKSQVLQYALSGLTEAENQVLHIIAAFRAPATYDVLAALLVGPGKPFPDEAKLDILLSDLEDRGLVGWDRRGNRYDLHPVVRGVAWSVLDPRVQEDIYENLASHFSALPKIDAAAVKSLDDLAGPIELYHTLIQLDRPGEAYEIFDDRILDAIGEHIWPFRELAELVEMFLIKPELIERLREQDNDGAMLMMLILGLSYFFCGDPKRALDTFGKIRPALVDEDEAHGPFLALTSMALCHLGALADAERAAREGVNADQDCGFNPSRPWISPLALGMVLIRRGECAQGTAWLHDYRMLDPAFPVFRATALAECGRVALHQDDVSSALVYAGQIVASTGDSDVPQARIQAMTLRAAAAEALGERDRAHEMLLNDSLVLAREARLVDSEAEVLIQLGYWNVHDDSLDAARRRVADALQIVEHGQLKIRQVDALNLLSAIEHACGNLREAARAAAEAYRLALCDGPPFVYEWGIRQARENLAAAGEPEPGGWPPPGSPVEMPELASAPISLIGALALRPPLPDDALTRIIGHLPEDRDSEVALRALLESDLSSTLVRAAASGRLSELQTGADQA